MRRLLLPALAGSAIAAAYGWSELVGFAWSDYETANQAPLHALVHGHLGAFLQTAPIEGPSLLLRAPFACAAWLWGGGDMAVYRLMAVPGLLAGVVLGVLLWHLRERRFGARAWGMLVVLLAAGNPVTLRALDIGHPEELLGAALCVGAVLAALHRRPWLAAVLLGLALGNKAWAVLAIPPVLLALERRRWSVLAIAAGIAALLVAPFLLYSHSGGAAVASAGHTDAVFQPWQVWWPFGAHGHVVRGMFGDVKAGYRAAPAWIGSFTHPLIALLTLPATIAWRLTRHRGRAPSDVLLLLALLLLARCVLDPADNVYYHLPFLMALLAWEALERPGPPLLAAGASALVWLSFQVFPGRVSPDAQCLAYLAWSLPALALLARAAFAAGAAQATETHAWVRFPVHQGSQPTGRHRWRGRPAGAPPRA